MDLEKLQKDVEALEILVPDIQAEKTSAVREFAMGLRKILSSFLKDRKEPIRPGRIFTDAAAKNIVPGDIAPRADALINRWTGAVVPQDPQAIKEDAARLLSVARKTLPVLKSYRKNK